ncbi:Terminal organelle assembly protein [Salix suchowensis]|nr:Terminal organelle assembly protein [Salix suchowensis]
MLCSGCARFGKLMRFMLIYWKDCAMRGFNSVIKLGSAALLLIMWSCFLSLTSMSCLLYVLLCMGAAGTAVQYLGYTPGLFIVGLFAILILWMYANFWITGTLFIVGGYLFSLNHARLVVFMATIYAIYFVKVQVGWHGVFLSVNLTFFSNDVLNFLLQWCDNVSESTQSDEHKESETVLEDEFSAECEFSFPVDESEKVQPCKSSSKPVASSSVVNNQKESSARKVVVEETSSTNEMKRILDSVNHYEALGFPCHKRIDVAILKKEYRKKAMLVHPDKNMGSPLASESFKKLQCAYEVLSDSLKKRDYDEQLRKEEFKTRSVCQKSHAPITAQPLAGYYISSEANLHRIWIRPSLSLKPAFPLPENQETQTPPGSTPPALPTPLPPPTMTPPPPASSPPCQDEANLTPLYHSLTFHLFLHSPQFLWLHSCGFIRLHFTRDWRWR